MFELVYTSAPQGLRSGATGYTVVAQTESMPGDLAAALEGLSTYRHRTVSADTGRADNPIAFGHYAVSVGYRTYHVLSRVIDTGLDYSGRGNFLAHHIATTPGDLPLAGPAWALGRRGLFRDAWDGPPRSLSPRGPLPAGDSQPQACRLWERATGDAGWAGVLAAATDPARPAVVVYRPGQDVIGLLAEAIALLPAAERWQATFATYFLGTPAGVRCQWRCVPADSPDLPRLLAAGAGVVLRVDGAATVEPEGPLVEAARTGRVDQSTPRSRPLERPAVWTAPAVNYASARDPQGGPPKRAAAAVPASSPSWSMSSTSSGTRGSMDVKTLAAGLGLGVLLGTVLWLVFEIATGRSPLGPLEKANRDDPVFEKREGPKVAHSDPKLGQAGLAEELEHAKSEWRRWMRAAEETEGERQKSAARILELQNERARQLSEMSNLREENADLQAKLTERASSPKRPPLKKPKIQPDEPHDEVELRGPTTVAPGFAILPKPESLYIQPIGVPHPARAEGLSAPYVITLNKKELIKVEADGKLVNRSGLPGFPGIWSGLIAVTRQGEGEQPTHYYRAYKPPTVDLSRKPMANPPTEERKVVGNEVKVFIKDNGPPRWEFKIAEMVKDPDISDLAHYIANKGQLALGRKAQVKFSADLNGNQVQATHELTAPAGSPDDGLPTKLASKTGLQLTLDDGVLVVTADLSPLEGMRLYCKITQLEVVRPLKELPRFRASGLSVFYIGSRR